LKPGNILLNKERKTIKIGDFGLSALINNQNSTFFDEKVGTPSYIAP
jgi:serine/threonine protein kinase